MKCLNCNTEFEPKKSFAKFCSTNCRVKWNRKQPKKEEITKAKLDVVYNAILDLLRRPPENVSKDAGNFIKAQILKPDSPIEQIAKTFQQHMNELAELEYEDEYKKKFDEIQASTNLTPKQKQLLIQNMKSSKL